MYHHSVCVGAFLIYLLWIAKFAPVEMIIGQSQSAGVLSTEGAMETVTLPIPWVQWEEEGEWSQGHKTTKCDQCAKTKGPTTEVYNGEKEFLFYYIGKG